MRLGELLGLLPQDRIDELCLHLVPGGEEVLKHMRSHAVESLLRDSGFIEHKLFAHHPPVLALLRDLLEARDHRAPIEALRTVTMETTQQWADRVAAGSLAARYETFRIYRRILAAAWENDLKIDSSEHSLLALLRKELGMSVIEHFLISHHPDIQPYWRTDDCFDRELVELLNQAIIFRVGDEVVIPDEFVPRVQRALGFYISRGAAIRLLGYVSNEDLKHALETYDVKKSGDKSDRIERIIVDMVPIPDVLNSASNSELRDIARKVGASVAGDKEELVRRLIEHFEAGLDLRTVEESKAEEHIVVEPKELSEPAFRKLFTALSSHQLYELCSRHELRQSGTKEIRVSTLWESCYCERTFLKSLTNPVLSELCGEHQLDSGGSKDAMIERLLVHHRVEVESGSGVSEARKPSRNDLQAVADLLPGLLRVESRPAELRGGTPSVEGNVQMPYTTYSPEAEKVMTAIYERNLLLDFDWSEWKQDAQRFLDPKVVATASLDEVQRLLTLHVRTERLSEGHFAQMITAGHISALLRRLGELAEEGPA
jgi:hypothetical protein